MNIVYASDDNYAQLAGVSMLSLFENNKSADNINVFILDCDLSDENVSKLTSVAKQYQRNITFIKVRDIEKEIDVTLYTGRWSIAAYARLFVAALLPEDIEKVIYLDCDTMIRSSLDSLWNGNLESSIVGGVVGYKHWLAKKTYYYSKNSMYINSGVLLINLALWRKYDVETKCIAFLKFYKGRVITVDEIVLNGVIEGYIMPIHPRYNYCFDTPNGRLGTKRIISGGIYTKENFIEAANATVIMHFSGPRSVRPWIEGNYHPVYQQEYMTYRRISPWADAPLMKPPCEPVWKTTVRKIIHLLPDILLFRYLDFRSFQLCIKEYLYSRKMLRESTIKPDDWRISGSNQE